MIVFSLLTIIVAGAVIINIRDDVWWDGSLSLITKLHWWGEKRFLRAEKREKKVQVEKGEGPGGGYNGGLASGRYKCTTIRTITSSYYIPLLRPSKSSCNINEPFKFLPGPILDTFVVIIVNVCVKNPKTNTAKMTSTENSLMRNWPFKSVAS